MATILQDKLANFRAHINNTMLSPMRLSLLNSDMYRYQWLSLLKDVHHVETTFMRGYELL